MNKPSRRSDVLGEVSRECDYVVIGRLLDLIDPLDCERSFRFDLLERILRDRAVLAVHLAYRDLDIEPLLKLILLRPDCAHLGQCVTFDHLFCF